MIDVEVHAVVQAALSGGNLFIKYTENTNKNIYEQRITVCGLVGKAHGEGGGLLVLWWLEEGVVGGHRMAWRRTHI